MTNLTIVENHVVRPDTHPGFLQFVKLRGPPFHPSRLGGDTLPSVGPLAVPMRGWWDPKGLIASSHETQIFVLGVRITPEICILRRAEIDPNHGADDVKMWFDLKN